MIELKLPEEENRADVLGFYREVEADGGTCIGFRGDYDRWLREMQNRHTGRDLPAGFVRENFYLCYEDGALIGVFSLKFELTDCLLRFGGHIGYAVRPSARRRGAATEMLRRGLELAKGFGFDRVLCVCDADNIASEKVILKNGGVLENELYNPEDAVTVRRYWIDL